MTGSLRPLAEQVLVITGASSGIGLATAFLAAERGARVVLTARSADALEMAVLRIRALGGTATSLAGDVSSRWDLERVAQRALDAYGRIDTWINNAGVSIYGRLDRVSEADSRRLFDTNFWGVVNGSLVALPHVRASAGALINVGADVVEAGLPLQGMVHASKHAVKGFTDALRLEVEEVDHAPLAITLVQPTVVDTPYPQHARNYTDREPKVPEPAIDPQRVAEAILDAAVTPKREVRVGTGPSLAGVLARVAPSLADRLSAKQIDRQHYDEPPRRPEGTLYRAGHEGRVHGTGPMPATNVLRGPRGVA